MKTMQNPHNVMPIQSSQPDSAQRRRCLAHWGLCLMAMSALGARPANAQESPVRVAAASDLKFVLAQLARAFESTTGHKVELSFGSSGNFARQIRQGLPVHLFMSADEQWIFQLAQAGMTRTLPDHGPDQGVVYGTGRLALLVPMRSPIPLDPELKGVRSTWAAVEKFAIANPEHAPYGRAAQEALEKLGLWPMVRPKLVLGENIAQATQYVTTGAAQAGLTALALALAPEVARMARHVELPPTLHQPLRQRMVLLRNAPPAAQDFFAYLQTPPAKAVLARYGFVP